MVRKTFGDWSVDPIRTPTSDRLSRALSGAKALLLHYALAKERQAENVDTPPAGGVSTRPSGQASLRLRHHVHLQGDRGLRQQHRSPWRRSPDPSLRRDDSFHVCAVVPGRRPAACQKMFRPARRRSGVTRVPDAGHRPRDLKIQTSLGPPLSVTSAGISTPVLHCTCRDSVMPPISPAPTSV